jgi:hypothetical protein
MALNRSRTLGIAVPLSAGHRRAVRDGCTDAWSRDDPDRFSSEDCVPKRKDGRFRPGLFDARGKRIDGGDPSSGTADARGLSKPYLAYREV